jgi:hypothetical protein
MTLQLLLVALVGLAAVLYLGRQAWRTLKGGCSSGCCKAGKSVSEQPLIATSDLLQRVRQRSSRG